MSQVTPVVQRQFGASSVSFKTLASRREEISKKRTGFVNRFHPIPTDTFGAPFALKTAIPLVNQLKARNRLQTLHFNPAFLSVPEVCKLIRSSSTTIATQTSSSPGSKYEDASSLLRKEINKIFSNDMYDVMFYNETTLVNLENVHGVEGLINASAALDAPSSSSFNDDGSSRTDERPVHRMWYRNRFYICGAGKHCRPVYNTKKLSLKQQTASDTSNLFFSSETFVDELEKVFQRYRYKSRLWTTPNALSKTLALKNGETSRIQVPYALPKTLISGYEMERRLANSDDRFRVGKAFHFWARTGLRVNFSDEDFEKLFQCLKTTGNYGFYAWFSSLDLKLFGYKVRDGERSLMQFTEERLITCVPLCEPYISRERLEIFNSSPVLQSSPPAASSQPVVRILRNDFKWSVIPLSRVDLPQNEDDAASIREIPVADAQVLANLGIRTELPPLVLTMKIPVAAFNVSQLVPEESDVDLPAPWMTVPSGRKM